MPAEFKVQTLKGFRDYAPEEARLRQQIIDTCREVFELYGFLPLDTPALEYAETLESKYGEDEKLIYKFEDRGGRKVGLRYDLTVPLARFVAENFNELKFPFRRYQIAISWRADNPQKGRYREFMQADADIVGVESLAADAECVAIYNEILKRLGIKDYKILINNRQVFNELGKNLSLSSEQLSIVVRTIDKLDKITSAQAAAILREAGLNDSQINKVEEFLETPATNLPAFQEMKTYLEALDVPPNVYEFNTRIARGLDYYTGTVFEVTVLGSNFGSFGGAGRYDDLVAKFLGKKIPSVGMSVGVDRLLAYMIENGEVSSFKLKASKVLVMNLGTEYSAKSLEVLKTLRENNIASQYFYESKDLDKQFKYAESLGIPYAILVGEQELASDQVTFRDLNSREQQTVSLAEALVRLKS